MSEKALFPSSFAKPFIGSTAYRLSAIRRFPFLAAKHSPSCRQRKRSLGFARDDDTGKMRFPHTLCMMHGVFILHTIISSVARNGNTGRTFSQRTLYTIQRISIPPHYHFERSEKSFSSPFPSSFAKPFRGSTVPTFSRYGVSHFSLSDTRPLTANEKDPSTSLGMTLRKWRFPNIPFIRDVGYLFPPTVISSAARNLPCTLLFLASFAKGFPFSAVSHTALYRCARKIPRLRSG